MIGMAVVMQGIVMGRYTTDEDRSAVVIFTIAWNIHLIHSLYVSDTLCNFSISPFPPAHDIPTPTPA